MRSQHISSSRSSDSLPVDQAYNPFSPDQTADPHPMFARARREMPVFYSAPLNMWIVTRYDDITAILKDPVRFSSAESLRIHTPLTPEALAVLQERYAGGGALVNDDPPAHTRHRALVNKAFTPRRVAEMEPHICQIAQELIEAFVHDGQADLVRQFAYPLPMIVICELIGVPRSDMDLVKQWCDEWNALMSGRVSSEGQITGARAIVALHHYFVSLLEQRAQTPQKDLATGLVEARMEGESSVTVPEMANLLFSVTFGGHETTTKLISNAVALLLSHPEQWQALRANPSLAPNAVEETLRWDCPLLGMLRTTTEEVEVAGQRLPKGANVMLMFASANRDEQHGVQPDSFDIRRKPSDHLSFGRGIHYCLGAQLARLEGRIALEMLAQHLPTLRLQPGRSLVYAPNLVLRGLQSLPVTWEVA